MSNERRRLLSLGGNRCNGARPDAAVDGAVMQMFPLKSSNLDAYGYQPDPGDGKTGLLAIRFHGGEEWRYVGVPVDVFEAFLLADSRGSFFHTAIKPVYRAIKADSLP